MAISTLVMAVDSKAHLSAKLSELMSRRGTTQVSLAKIAGVSQSAISEFLTQKSFPKLGPLARIAAYYHVSFYELTGMEQLKGITPGVDMNLSPEVLQMVEIYKSASPEIKEAIDTVLRVWKKQKELEEKDKK